MVKKLKKISPKKKLATNKLPKAQTKTQKIKSKKIKAKKAAKENKKIKTKKTPKKKTKEEMDEEELLAELYGPGYDDDYFFYENDLENLPHDEFDIYEIPKTIKENEDYLKKFNCWIQRNFYIICLAAIVFLLIIFVIVCYMLVGVSATESGTYYNGLKGVI